MVFTVSLVRVDAAAVAEVTVMESLVEFDAPKILDNRCYYRDYGSRFRLAINKYHEHN